MSDDIKAIYNEILKKHPEAQITSIKDKHFIWRPLTREEYRQVRSLGLDPGREEELICGLCVLWPENYPWHNPEKAGYPTAVCNDILIYSGFLGWQDTKNLLASYESELQDFDHMMDAVIAAAFPSIRPDEPRMWTMRKALWVFSRAKWVLENIYGRRVVIKDPTTPQTGIPAQHQAKSSPASTPAQQSPTQHSDPFDGYAPEATWWPDELDPYDEPIPDIEGFPKV